MDEFKFPKMLEEYAARTKARFHMPGHKGKPCASFLDAVLPYDVTELDGTDDLLSPAVGGALTHDYAILREIYGTKSTIVCACGSTGAVYTVVGEAARRGGKFLVGRACHRSVINALSHFRADVVRCDTDEYGGIDYKSAEDAFAAGGISSFILTSPMYDGRIADIARLSALAHKHGALLIVDEAHGAHLPFFDGGRLCAYRNGADVVVQSLHKTMPSLTGASLIHSNGCFDERELVSSMAGVTTSSPSFLITASAFIGIDYVRRSDGDIMRELYNKIDAARERLARHGYSFPQYELSDPFRLVIYTRGVCAPEKLKAALRERGVEVEYCDGEAVICIPSVCNTDEDFDALVSCCESVEPDGFIPPARIKIPRTKAVMPIFVALNARREEIPTALAEHRICALPATPYPPGIPLCMPGEEYTKDACDAFLSLGFNTLSCVKEEKK